MTTSTPEFSIILLGATGYTGSLTASHITSSLPTTLKWAIAGRSPSALSSLASDLETLNPDRTPPSIILIDLEKKSLHELVKRTKLVINAIGPYHRYSEPIVEACATKGVHYLDFSTETPWISAMVSRYHGTAQSSGAVIIHAASNSSSPPDLLAWLLASKTQEKGGSLKEVVAKGELKMQGMGGGSLHTVLDTVARYGRSWLSAPDPFALIPLAARQLYTPSTATWTWGVRNDEELGTLAPSLTGVSNTAVIQRSAYLSPLLYDPSFTYQEYNPAPGTFSAILIALLTRVMLLLLSLPLFRMLIAKLSFKPGEGPDWKVNASKEGVRYDMVGTAVDGGKVKGRFEYRGAVVSVSAMLVAESAGVLLNLVERGETDRKGGMQTPSFLGEELVERMRVCGCVFEVEG